MKKYKIVAAVFAIAIAAISVAKAENIDIGFDVTRSADVSSLKEMVVRSETGFEMNKVRFEGYTPEVACSTLELDSRDGTYIHKYVPMESILLSKTCDNNGCYMENTREVANAEITINTRQLSDSETERIEVCHNFVNRKGSYRIISSPFVYTARVKQPTSYSSYSLELTPLPRTTVAATASVFGPQRKVDFNKTFAKGEKPEYETVGCSDTGKVWQIKQDDYRTMGREGFEIYVCKFVVTWDCKWKNCFKPYPHTDPNGCACKESCSDTAQNTGQCAWEQISN